MQIGRPRALLLRIFQLTNDPTHGYAACTEGDSPNVDFHVRRSTTARASGRLLVTAAMAVALASCTPLRTPWHVERDHARSLTPDAPVRSVAPLHATDVVRVRVYLDVDYRNQNRDAEERVRATFEEASLQLVEALGLSFYVVEMVPWERRGADLAAAFEELERTDSGEDVDFVVGFVTSAPLWTSSLHDLGLARLLGRHAVLRGMNNIEERKALDEVLRLLSNEERERVFRARRLHKEVVVLLHEWAHTVGGNHLADPEEILNPKHDVRQQGFAPASLPVLALGVRWHRASSDEERSLIADELVGVLSTPRGAPCDEPSRRQLLALVGREQRESSGSEGSDGQRHEPDAAMPATPATAAARKPPQHRDVLTPEDRASLEEIELLCAAGDSAAARARGRPLFDAHPEDAYAPTGPATSRRSQRSARRSSARPWARADLTRWRTEARSSALGSADRGRERASGVPRGCADARSHPRRREPSPSAPSPRANERLRAP